MIFVKWPLPDFLFLKWFYFFNLRLSVPIHSNGIHEKTSLLFLWQFLWQCSIPLCCFSAFLLSLSLSSLGPPPQGNCKTKSLEIGECKFLGWNGPSKDQKCQQARKLKSWKADNLKSWKKRFKRVTGWKWQNYKITSLILVLMHGMVTQCQDFKITWFKDFLFIQI